ncbi:hypothetical protein ABH935_005434 [Catenulispora sp. GAS73]|uniref:transposase n=1 Tax=Catenulispora sp. GAS73 TaxID=3156269 RepID=UPI003511E8D9
MVADLADLPAKVGKPILAAWNVKEDLRDLLDLHGANPTREQIGKLLIWFYENAAAFGLPEMERPANTVSTWWPQILAGISTGITNAVSEGVNRLIKTDARCAFGYRNPATQRLRARCATTRRARGHLTTRTSGPCSTQSFDQARLSSQRRFKQYSEERPVLRGEAGPV